MVSEWIEDGIAGPGVRLSELDPGSNIFLVV